MPFIEMKVLCTRPNREDNPAEDEICYFNADDITGVKIIREVDINYQTPDRYAKVFLRGDDEPLYLRYEQFQHVQSQLKRLMP